MEFKLGCKLGYRTKGDTPFLFNIEAQTFGAQIVSEEMLTLTPNVPIDRWTMPRAATGIFA